MCGYNMRSKSTKSKKDRGFYVVPIKIGFANNMCDWQIKQMPTNKFLVLL